jgi:hypothetical protein
VKKSRSLEFISKSRRLQQMTIPGSGKDDTAYYEPAINVSPFRRNQTA